MQSADCTATVQSADCTVQSADCARFPDCMEHIQRFAENPRFGIAVSIGYTVLRGKKDFTIEFCDVL